MTAETKIRTLASAVPALQAIFGTPAFRWFDTQLPPGYQERGTCARLWRVSTVPLYSNSGLNQLDAPRFQIDILDADAEKARAAALAVIAFLGTLNLSDNRQFGSPAVAPRQFPTFVLNRRHGLDFQLDPPVPVETIDFRAWALET